MIVNTMREYLSLPSLLIKMKLLNNQPSNEVDEHMFKYGDEEKQELLIVSPKDKHKETVLVFVHGGGWKSGSVSSFKFVGHYFAKQGYTVILTGYRHVPHARYPDQVNDVIKAIEIGVNELKEMGLYKKKLILMGHSAGAQIASLITMKNLLNESDLHSHDIKGLLCISGPLDFSKCKGSEIVKMIDDYLPNMADRFAADPSKNLIREDALEILCIHGEDDPLISIDASLAFVSKVNEKKSIHADMVALKKGLHSNLVMLLEGSMEESKLINKWIGDLDKSHEV